MFYDFQFVILQCFEKRKSSGIQNGDRKVNFRPLLLSYNQQHNDTVLLNHKLYSYIDDFVEKLLFWKEKFLTCLLKDSFTFMGVQVISVSVKI